ncbi:hypothetical protein [Plantactinospora sp. GCM10030261]|uniref:hypothetical protein n=1 Tax=Plantactinospora sp. GCM10030261 TaxID=3273420 RepID=UPI0036207237
MNKPRTSRIPAPLYAAAGAGELAYESLRKLPEVVTGLGDRAATTSVELREKAAASLREANRTAETLRERTVREFDADVDRLREAALRNAAVVLTNAQTVQQRAFSAYGALVNRGERLIGTGVVQAAETVNADMAATEVAEVAASPATVAETVESTPAVRKPRQPRTRKTVAAESPASRTPAKTATRQAGTKQAAAKQSTTKRTAPKA